MNLLAGNIRHLSFREWERIQAQAKPERDDIIIRLLYETGCTVNELVNIKKADLCEGGLRIARRSARNRHARQVFVSDKLLGKIRNFCSAMPEDAHILCTRQSSAMTTKRVRQLVQHYCMLAGVSDAGPQVLRYTHIAHAYQKQVPPDAIQRQVGLRRSRAIEIFQQLPRQDTREAYKGFIE